MELNKDTFEKLKSMYSDNGIERGGYILRSGEVVEIENCADEKSDNFTFSCYDLDKMEKSDVIATFHTHINKSSNLSKEDYDSFVNWDYLYHFIVGKDKISCYKVSNRGTVVIEGIDVS